MGDTFGIMAYSALADVNATLKDVNSAVGELNRLVDVDVNEAVATTAETRLNIPTYTAGTCQVETATVSGTITAAGNASVVVTAKAVTGSPVSISVPLALNDDVNAIATKIRQALTDTAAVSSKFVVSGTADKVVLTAKAAAENDVTLNINLATGTATGLTPAPNSASTTAGSKDEIVHPSILFFPKKWNGYQYWLAYTCFDNGDSQFENPCIAVSNDNTTWVTPPGVVNPLVPKPSGTGYNADVHIFMSPDEKTMYMLYKVTSGSTHYTRLLASQDGVNWSTPVELFSGPIEDVSYSVVYDGTQYLMWTVRPSVDPNALYMRTSARPEGPWSAPVLCTISLPDTPGTQIWHPEVRKLGNQYHMLVMVVTDNVLYFGKSNDGLDWTFGKQPLMDKETYSIYSSYLNTRYYKSTMFPMIGADGLKYGLWYNSAVPYYVCYTEITFDRTKKLMDKNNRFAQAVLGISPWLICDTFNRADTTAGLGAATSGNAWTKVMGNDLGILGGKAYLPTAANTRWITELGVTNYYVEMEMSTLGAAEAYMLFRYVDSTHLWRFGHSAYVLVVQKIDGGAPVSMTNAVYVIKAGDRIGVKCNGNNLSFYRNDKFLFSVNDAACNTGTKVGINTDNTTARIDNFIAMAI